MALKPTAADLKTGYAVTNMLADPLYRTVVYRGVPKVTPPALEAGFKIHKAITTLAGKPVKLDALHQNDRLVVRISGNATDLAYHQSVIVDMLPAGFEIEAILRPTKGSMVDGYDWVGAVNDLKVGEARDDRFVAALDLQDKSSTYDDDDRGMDNEESEDGNGAEQPHKVNLRETFNVAYVVRAVTPGKFALPAAVIEDLYKPGQIARTAGQSVAIAAAP